MSETRYYAEQLDGRPEDAETASMWSVVDSTTDQIVASWRETPLSGMTEQEASETAAAFNRIG